MITALLLLWWYLHYAAETEARLARVATRPALITSGVVHVEAP